MLLGVIFTLTTVLILPKIPLYYVVSDEFMTKPWIYVFLYVNATIILTRLKYYAGWAFCQAGVASCGLAYRDVNE